MDIKNKVVIITGASSGIGLSTARLFAKKGAKVVLASRSYEKLKKIAAALPQSLVITTDMTNKTTIKNLIKKTYQYFGRIDILINNAGRSMYYPVEKIDIKKYRYILDLNLIGPLLAMQEVIPIMKKQGSGIIINISSGTSKMYIPNIAAYASTKNALNTITLTARQELAKDNIKVGVIYPYMTATNFVKNTIQSEKFDFHASQIRNKDIPPEDTPELVAEKILAAIENEKAETYVHDWIGQR